MEGMSKGQSGLQQVCMAELAFALEASGNVAERCQTGRDREPENKSKPTTHKPRTSLRCKVWEACSPRLVVCSRAPAGRGGGPALRARTSSGTPRRHRVFQSHAVAGKRHSCQELLKIRHPRNASAAVRLYCSCMSLWLAIVKQFWGWGRCPREPRRCANSAGNACRHTPYP